MGFMRRPKTSAPCFEFVCGFAPLFRAHFYTHDQEGPRSSPCITTDRLSGVVSDLRVFFSSASKLCLLRSTPQSLRHAVREEGRYRSFVFWVSIARKLYTAGIWKRPPTRRRMANKDTEKVQKSKH